MRPEVTEAIKWLDYASDDLAYGKLGITHLPRPASWSIHQAAEKGLKAINLMFYGKSPRTHDIVYLLSLLGPKLYAPEEVRESVLRLAEITTATRYPSDDMPPITMRDAEEYLASAETILVWAKQVISKEIS